MVGNLLTQTPVVRGITERNQILEMAQEISADGLNEVHIENNFLFFYA